MIEIWKEYASCQTKSQKLDNQDRTITKKVWFSDLELLEIHQKINCEQDSYTSPETSSINKQKRLAERNRQLRKIKNPLNQTKHNQITELKH